MPVAEGVALHLEERVAEDDVGDVAGVDVRVAGARSGLRGGGAPSPLSPSCTLPAGAPARRA